MQKFYINDDIANEAHYKHKNNMIDTSKYNIFTFLPKALLYQFMRLANCYFLMIAIIQCIPSLSPLSPLTAIAPISFVIAVSLVREAFEDYNRHVYDTAMNNEEVCIYKNQGFKTEISGNIKIGNIILVEENQSFPADVILLDSNLKDGIAYIETATLDGEKSLKQKTAHIATSGFFNNGGTWKNNFNFRGFCQCDKPNPDLYKLEGNLDFTLTEIENIKKSPVKIPIEAKQLLPKGAILKNTQFIIGFVIYTGHNTKLLQNSKKSRVKISKIESLLSKLLVGILCFQILLCIITSIAHSIYYEENLQYLTYLEFPSDFSIKSDSVFIFFTYLLLLNTMIPISLIITLEIVKVIQGKFIECDVEMFSYVRNT
jgi:phospholipid-transporting ATPase